MSWALIVRVGGGSGATLMSGGMRHSVSGSKRRLAASMVRDAQGKALELEGHR